MWRVDLFLLLIWVSGSQAMLPTCFPSLSAQWEFDSSTNDTSGNGHNSVSGTVGFDAVDFVFGTAAAQFNGTTHGLRYSDGSWMNDPFDQMSVGFWLKPASLSPGTAQTIYDEGGNTNGVYIYLDTTGEIVVNVQESQVITTPARFAFPADGLYHHIAVVYDFGLVTVYLDGVVQGTPLATGFGTMISHSSDGGFGATFGGNAGDATHASYAGRLDDAFRTLDVLDAAALLAYVTQAPERDHGDAPASYGQADHALPLVPSTLHLGTVPPDGECTQGPLYGPGDGDDSLGIDDEDAVTSFLPQEISPADAYPVQVQVTNTSGGPANLCGWLDFDIAGQPGAGSFEADEGVCVPVPDGDTSATLTFTVPADFVAATGVATFARFRLSSDALTTASATGAATDGEVEDHRIPVNTFSFPPITSFTTCGLSGIGAAWPWDGDTDDASGNSHDLIAGSTTFDAADRVSGQSADLDGTTHQLQYSDGTFMNAAFAEVSLGFWMKPAVLPPATVQTLVDEGGTVNGIYIEYDTTGEIVVFVQENNTIFTVARFAFPTDGDWHHVSVTYDDGDTAAYLDGVLQASVATGFATMIAHPSAGGFGQTFNGNAGDRTSGRFAGQLDEGFRTLSALSAGELADYVACMAQKDFGDAPMSYASAGHDRALVGAGEVFLGTLSPDQENAVAPGTGAADGDDTAGGDDEDGVPVFVPIEATPGGFYGVEVQTTNTSGGPATVCGWIDFDIAGQPGDGTFEADEGVCAPAPAGVGTVFLGFTVPADYVVMPGEVTYARFRTSNAPLTTASSGGFLPTGEVEDYQLPVDTLTAVRLIDFRAVPEAGGVEVTWKTLTEIQNRSFLLEASTTADGPWRPVGQGEIPGRGTFLGTTEYAVRDEFAPVTGPAFYRLIDVDLSGSRQLHGPIGVDRDGDGLDFLEELAHGLSDRDPTDAGLDPDGDGLSNREEIHRGRDPYLPETPFTFPDQTSSPVPLAKHSALELVEESPEARVYELRVPRFVSKLAKLQGRDFHRIEIPDLIHGATTTPGQPRLPVVGALLPAGFTDFEVLEVSTEVHAGLVVIPAPLMDARDQLENVPPRYPTTLPFYETASEYPETLVEIEGTIQRPRLVIHPFAFRPAVNELELRTRIRVRVRRSGQARFGLQAASSPDLGVSGLPVGPTLRLRTTEPGVYRVTGADLAAQGVDLQSLVPANLALFRRGHPVPLRVEARTTFGLGDSFSFYAAFAGDRFAAGDGYHLVLGKDPGLRWAPAPAVPGAASAPLLPSYRHRVHQEFLETYFATLPGPPSEERFVAGFGRQPTVPPIGTIAPARVDFPVTLTGLAPGATPAAVRLRYGVVEDYPGAPDHHHRLWFNGTKIEDQAWSGNGRREAAGSVPSGIQTPGTHQVGLEATLDGLSPAVRGDQFLPLSLVVEYDRLPVVVGDLVRYRAAPGSGRVLFTGFTSAVIIVLDVTDPDRPTLVDAPVSALGAGFAVEISHHPTQARELLAYTEATTRSPSLRAVVRTGIRSAQTRAGWLAIVPSGWDDALGPLVSLRHRQGLEPLVVDVETIADEFGGGVLRPQAIRDFVAYARATWDRPPEFLVLASDTHMNPRRRPGAWNVWATSAPVGVPTPLSLAGGGIAPSETGDDGWYVRPASDAPPEIAVGRLPARSRAELLAIATKIAGYASATGPWTRQVLSVADEKEPVYARLAEERLHDLLPGLGVRRVHPGVTPDPVAALQAALLDGASFVQYLGHGSFDFWSQANLLTAAVGGNLANAQRLPVVMSMTCWDNHFVLLPEFGLEGLGETLVRNPIGGAVAFLGAGVQSAVFPKDLLHRGMMRHLFQGGERRIGEALRLSLAEYLANTGDDDGLLAGYHLIGDPATRLQIPNPIRPAALQATTAKDGTVALSWSPGAGPTPDYFEILVLDAAGTWIQAGTATGTEFVDRGFAETASATAARSYSVRAWSRDGLGSSLATVVDALPVASSLASRNPGSAGCSFDPRQTSGGNPLWFLSLLAVTASRRRRLLLSAS